MKRIMTYRLLPIVALLAVCGCISQSQTTSGSKIPTKLNIPADLKVTKADWIDTTRHRVGWYLGIQMLRGKAITARDGVHPIHIMKADMPQFPTGLVMKDDLIIGVNGTLLPKHPVDEFVYQIKRTLKKSKTKILTVTRWRKGEIATVNFDLSPMIKLAQIPDLTKGGKPDHTRDWSLGPIGANGWGYSRNAANGASRDCRQLLITLVDESGPAAGKLTVGDVIVGIGKAKFSHDARKALAAAIDEAEKVESKGLLTLNVWRDGKDVTVGLTLPVLGTYSATTPFDCAKTDKIIERGVAYMKANEEALLKPGGWINYINGLGLLATGREDVMPMVKKLAHGSLLKPGETLSVEKHVGMTCWWWSYKTVFLCEYYLRTGDKAVLPTIEEHATKIALGQSGAGTWGHTYAARENTGYYHGHLGGYGAINQQGLTCMIALPLAVKCGVKNKEVMDAIKRGDDFFSYFIDKGTIPYGDHGAANAWWDDNGKSGAAAVFFDLMKKRKGAQFFCDMVLGSVPNGRESGHTGHFWSHLWGGVGAARGGDRGLQAFMKEMNPIFTLERQHTGRFAFQDNAGEKGDRGKPKAKWDCTGTRLLQLCVPKRVLYVTGRDTPKESHLTETRISKIFRAGRLDGNPKAWEKLTQSEILELLSDPLPPARSLACRILAEREIKCVDTLIEMLDGTDKYARYGAAEALGTVGYANKQAADKLIGLMASGGDTQLRIYAINALTVSDKRQGLLTVAKPAIPVLMKMAVTPAADDPRKVLQHDIARALFYNGNAQAKKGLIAYYGMDGVDKSLLIPAVKEILTNANGSARSVMSNYLYPHLTKAECDQLWGDVYRTSRHIAPSGIMFASGNRTHGLNLMADHHIKEGLDLAVWYLRWQKGHGSGKRVPAALEAIEKYGSHAKRVIPKLEEYAAHWESTRNKRRPISPDDKANRIRKTIEAIKAMPPADFKLVSIEGTLKKFGLEYPPKPIVIQPEK